MYFICYFEKSTELLTSTGGEINKYTYTNNERRKKVAVDKIYEKT